MLNKKMRKETMMTKTKKTKECELRMANQATMISNRCSYIVEKIVEHNWLDDVCQQYLIPLRVCDELTELQGTLMLLVKWKGYDDIKDHTWEEEGGLMYA